MLQVIFSKAVGDRFNISIYDMHLEQKCIPFVEASPPAELAEMTAADVMASPVETLREVEDVRAVLKVLLETDHNGFPVVRTVGTRTDSFVGIVLRSQLLVLLEKRAWAAPERSLFTSGASQASNEGNLTRHDFATSLSSRTANARAIAASLSDTDLDAKVDLALVMTPAPFQVQRLCPVDRVYALFRAMGMRHLVVVDEANGVAGIITRKDIRSDFSQDLS